MQATPPFPEITVTTSERRFYNGVASAILRKTVIEHTRCKGYIPSSRWRHVRSRKEVSVFRSTRTRDDDPSSSSGTSTQTGVMIGSGQILGTLEEVMDGIYCDSTADLRRVSALLGHKLVDCAVLNVTERRMPSDPFRFEGIKWRAAKAPWGISTNQDVLTYERMGTIVDKQGTEVAYHVIQSIDRAEWPANTIKNFKRAQTCVCYLYRRDSRGLVRCFFWGEVADLSPMTQRAAEYVIAGSWLNVVRSVKCARAKRCSALVAACTEHSMESAGSMCRVCYKRASLLGSRLVACAGCSQTACKSCSSYQPIFQVDSKTGGSEERRFCKLCMGRVRSLTSVQTRSPSPSMVTPTASMPIQRSRWDSAPASLCVAAPTTSSSLSPPRERKMSRRVRYDLLEPPSYPVATHTRPHRTESSYHYTGVLHKPRVEGHSTYPRERLVDLHSSVSPTASDSSSESIVSSAEVDTNVDHAHRVPTDMAPMESRHTEALGEFDLDLDLDLSTTTTAADTSSSNGNNSADELERTHHELVFTWRDDGVGSSDGDKESFLDDLYVDVRPRGGKQRRS